MTMKSILVEIEGKTPLLVNRFTEEQQEKAERGSSTAMATADKGTPLTQATPHLYVDNKNRPVIPGPNFFSCLVESGKFHKSGKRQLTTGRASLIPAGISVCDVESVILGPDGRPAPWVVDSRPVVNPATRGRRPCHRPRFDEWRLSFTLAVDDSMFDPQLVRTLVDDAGRRIGLGDFRPDRRGPFGQFRVIRWQVEEVVPLGKVA